MKNKFLLAGLVIGVLAVIFGISQTLLLKKAHSTFENYYAFRGCQKLLNKTDTQGTCQIASGDTIKIVKFNNKWYLDGDLPWGCVGSICFGL